MQKLKYDLVEDKLINLGLKIFTANDLGQIFGAGKRANFSPFCQLDFCR